AADAVEEAAALADALGAPVYQQTIIDGAHFPSAHPAYLGVLTRSQPVVRERLTPYDLMVCIGADALKMSVYSTFEPMPEGLKLVQIGQRDWEIGKNYACDMAIGADVKETLKALIPALVAKGGAALAAKAKARLAEIAPKNRTAAKAEKAKKAAA
ncbi:MAG: thiamine pyrophosphate-binding protein, partial [Alphaproteobacteria bacterium]